MRQLDHPNIVKLIDFSESRQYYYIILELCPGGELFHQIVRLTYFSENLSRHVIIQVAKALEYLHEEAGVVHRFVPHPFFSFVRIRWRLTSFIATSSPKICDSIQRVLFLRGTLNQGALMRKTRPMKASLSRELALVGSAS